MIMHNSAFWGALVFESSWHLLFACVSATEPWPDDVCLYQQYAGKIADFTNDFHVIVDIYCNGEFIFQLNWWLRQSFLGCALFITLTLVTQVYTVSVALSLNNFTASPIGQSTTWLESCGRGVGLGGGGEMRYFRVKTVISAAAEMKQCLLLLWSLSGSLGMSFYLKKTNCWKQWYIIVCLFFVVLVSTFS